jgi:hypothetical protein
MATLLSVGHDWWLARWRRVVVPVWLLLSCGCIHLAPMPRLRPAEIDVREIDRLAEFVSAENPEIREFGERALADLLRSGQCYEVLVQGDLCQMDDASETRPISPAEVRELSMRAGCDSYLICHLSSGEPVSIEPDMRAVRLGYELHRAMDGELLDAGSTVVPYEFSDEDEDSAKQAGVLSSAMCDAVTLAVTQLSHRLTPYTSIEEVELAFAPWDVSGARIYWGNFLASRGRWDDAARQWESAMRSEGGNRAAMFNLAVAAEAQGNFARARRYFDAADRIPRVRRQEAIRGLERESQSHFLAAVQQAPTVRTEGPAVQTRPVAASSALTSLTIRRLPDVANEPNADGIHTVSYEFPPSP